VKGAKGPFRVQSTVFSNQYGLKKRQGLSQNLF